MRIVKISLLILFVLPERLISFFLQLSLSPICIATLLSLDTFITLVMVINDFWQRIQGKSIFKVPFLLSLVYLVNVLNSDGSSQRIDKRNAIEISNLLIQHVKVRYPFFFIHHHITILQIDSKILHHIIAEASLPNRIQEHLKGNFYRKWMLYFCKGMKKNPVLLTSQHIPQLFFLPCYHSIHLILNIKELTFTLLVSLVAFILLVNIMTICADLSNNHSSQQRHIKVR